MAEVKPEGLEGGKEQSSNDELFSGPLEYPEGDGSQSSEQPKVEVKSDPGASSSESEDSELGNLYEDLEKDIPEALKSHATNVKKKVQKFLTQARQKDSEKLKLLEANQVTEDLKRDYSTLYGWYEKIQKNPKEGLKELAAGLGISVKALLESDLLPQVEELTVDKLVTREDYARYAEQIAEKKTKALQEKLDAQEKYLNELRGSSVQKEHVQRGSEALKDAMDNLPGFAVEVDGKKVLSKEGWEALDAVVKRGEFHGPNALRNAYRAITADTYAGKAKELESKISDLKKNITGATTPPGRPSPKTITAPKSPEEFWASLSSEPLTD